MRQFITDGENVLIEVTGQKPALFAPPGGDHNRQAVAVAAELGYKTVLWTIDTVDWQRPAPTTIIDRVVGRASNGALVLMHPTQPTLEALPIILDQLIQKGYRLVTVGNSLQTKCAVRGSSRCPHLPVLGARVQRPSSRTQKRSAA